jgi:single-stranded-DNA-specific exonuclease
MTDLPHLNKEKLFNILSNRFDEEKKLSHIPNPSLLHDGEKSAKKIADAIKNNKRVTVVGDYDVDGVTSTAIMVEFFRQIPYPLEAIIPNRFNDGYGVSPKILDKLDTDLIITVDNGITAIDAAKICKGRNIDLIITDHHTPGTILPEAYSIIDPKLDKCEYPFKDICGAQVAWLLCALIKKELSLNTDMKQFLDLLAIAIIADIMPLIDINRSIVKEGLKLLSYSNRPASVIIRDFLNKEKITSEDIAFLIAPRLNSAGRLEDASIALNFFTAQNTNSAYNYFEKLGSLNELRKEIEADATKEAIDAVNDNDKIIVVASENWHEGVVGIIASRLVDKFGKPAIVLNINGNTAKGSARSIGEVNIYELINENSSHLTKFGGHKMAAGLSLNMNNIDNFRDDINKSATKISKEDFTQKEKVLGILKSDDIDFELLDILEQFEPYGEANTKPLFFIKDAEIVDIQLMGKDKSHSKIYIKQSSLDKTLEVIAFRTVYDMPKDRKINCSYTISKNLYNNRLSIQLLLNKNYL